MGSDQSTQGPAGHCPTVQHLGLGAADRRGLNTHSTVLHCGTVLCAHTIVLMRNRKPGGSGWGCGMTREHPACGCRQYRPGPRPKVGYGHATPSECTRTQYASLFGVRYFMSPAERNKSTYVHTVSLSVSFFIHYLPTHPGGRTPCTRTHDRTVCCVADGCPTAWVAVGSECERGGRCALDMPPGGGCTRAACEICAATVARTSL